MDLAGLRGLCGSHLLVCSSRILRPRAALEVGEAPDRRGIAESKGCAEEGRREEGSGESREKESGQEGCCQEEGAYKEGRQEGRQEKETLSVRLLQARASARVFLLRCEST